MFSEEIKQVVFTAVTCVLLAIVLTFASQLIGVKKDLIAVRQDEINTQNLMSEAFEFSKYNATHVTGLDVIDAIAEYKKDKDMQVIVERQTSSGKSTYVYNYTLYKSKPTLYTLKELQKTWLTTTKYRAYVYSNVPFYGVNASNGSISYTTSATSDLLTALKKPDVYTTDDIYGSQMVVETINTIVFVLE